LSQPITALQCGLELAVAVPRSQKEYERRIGDALQSTSSLREMMSALRELVESEDLGEDAEPIDLGELFSSLRDSLAKLAEMNECNIDVQSTQQITVCASQGKLSRLMLFLAERVTVRQGTLRASAERINHKVEIGIETDAQNLKNASEGRSWRDRVNEIRMNAAVNYVGTLGGVLRPSEAGYRIELPVVGS
jgi:signal transduction histidine kinase